VCVSKFSYKGKYAPSKAFFFSNLLKGATMLSITQGESKPHLTNPKRSGMSPNLSKVTQQVAEVIQSCFLKGFNGFEGQKTKFIGKKKDQKVKKNGEKCQKIFSREKAKPKSILMVRASRKKRKQIISAMASNSQILWATQGKFS
jgi:hypothetical protein